MSEVTELIKTIFFSITKPKEASLRTGSSAVDRDVISVKFSVP